MNIIQNPRTIECISRIKNGLKILRDLDIIYDDDFTFKQRDTCYYYEPKIVRSEYIAAFDMDWTLSYNERHLFPKDTDDIHILPNRRLALENLIKSGYNIVLFTNQYSRTKSERLNRCKRVQTFLQKLQLPVFAYIATEKDQYRKPNIGMWNIFVNNNPVQKVIFVGDALGRPQDFSDSDLIFGRSITPITEVYSPEDFFGHSEIPYFRPLKELVVFVGAAGTGKSTYYQSYLQDHVHIEQDKLGSRPKVLKELRNSFTTGRSIVIDSTNPSQEGREEYYRLAGENGYNIKVLYFIRNGTGFNKLRSKPVPTIAYHIFYKKLDPPTVENTPGGVFYIT
jgi:bifunctional polynucleotide phosphatase/kinase